MLRRSHQAAGVLAVLILFPAAAGCGKQAPPPLPPEESWQRRVLYTEPTEAEEPLLIFPRSLAVLGDSLYVLDGRLVRVVCFALPGGKPAGFFGGPGEGPGELGAYPHAVVADAQGVGVANLNHVSWFTPGGRFLRREAIPLGNLIDPSLQRSRGGWLLNLNYSGPGKPLVIYLTSDGDTLRYAPAASPAGTSEVSALELHSVRAARLEDGSVLLAWVQQNRIEIVTPAGEVLTRDAWDHFPETVARRPDGRIRGMPGFSLAAWAGRDRLWVLDGTGSRLRAYDERGRLVRRARLDGPVLAVAEAPDGTLLAVDGSDRILRLEPQAVVVAEAPIRSAGDPAPQDTTAAGDDLLPGRLLLRIDDLPGLLDRYGRGRDRESIRPGAPPFSLQMAVGSSRIYVGYGDGQGLLLGERRGTWQVESEVMPRPGGRFGWEVVMGGDRPQVLVSNAGIFPLDGLRGDLSWAADDWPRQALWLGGQQWLVHTTDPEADPVLWRGDSLIGALVPAGGGGSHRPAGRTYPATYNRWRLLPWTDGGVLIFDESGVRLALWRQGVLGEWYPLQGAGIRSVQGHIDYNEVVGAATLPGVGLLLLAVDEALESARPNRLLLVDQQGRTRRIWRLPLRERLRGIGIDQQGRIFLQSRWRVLEWEAGAGHLGRAMADPAGEQPYPPPADDPGRGQEMAGLLGPLTTLEGTSFEPDLQRLRLWVLIHDREWCAPCLDEVPLLAALADSALGYSGGALLVALGDRRTARRTLAGLNLGMPVAVSGRYEVPPGLGDGSTPVRAVVRGGRLEKVIARPVTHPAGRAELRGALQLE